MNADRPDPSRPEDPDHGLDIDAAFADIVAHWEPAEAADADGRTPGPDPLADRPAAGTEPEPATPFEDDPSGAAGAGAAPPPGQRGEQERLRDLFRPAWEEPARPAPEDDEARWTPPPPPSIPHPEPRRGLAWVCLFGTPVFALVLLVLGLTPPGWATLMMVAAFVGGFAYLVATMSAAPPDPWSGDDGARL